MEKKTVHPAKLVFHAWLRDETYIGLVSIQLNQKKIQELSETQLAWL